jgi:N-terminal domain of galactosyltransferase/Glycosyl transferase family 2
MGVEFEVSKRPLVSVCMTTASDDRPMEHRQESIYDLLRISIADQTYDGPVEVIVADARDDRLGPELGAPWGRVDRVVMVKQVQHDRIAIAGARNTAAAFARGELIVFVDDCTELLPSFLEAAVSVHARGKIPTRVLLTASRPRACGKIATRDLLRARCYDDVDPVWRNQGCPVDATEWPLSGQAGGVFVVPAETLFRLNGFDENFDGNWGCEDIEFWTRFDRLKIPRVGRADLAVLRWPHRPTPARKMLRRCRELYAQWAYRSKRIEANRRLSGAVLQEIYRAPVCAPSCVLCAAPDRAAQVETYRAIPADFDLRALRSAYSARPSGVYLDPWR